MTATVDAAELVREFRSLLPDNAARQLHQNGTLTQLLIRAVSTQGWPLRQLAAECGRDLAGTVNAGGVVMYRLGQAADHSPPHQRVKVAQRHRASCDGWIYTTPDVPDGHDGPLPELAYTKCDGCAPAPADNPGRKPA